MELAQAFPVTEKKALESLFAEEGPFAPGIAVDCVPTPTVPAPPALCLHPVRGLGVSTDVSMPSSATGPPEAPRGDVGGAASTEDTKGDDLPERLLREIWRLSVNFRSLAQAVKIQAAQQQRECDLAKPLNDPVDDWYMTVKNCALQRDLIFQPLEGGGPLVSPEVRDPQGWPTWEPFDWQLVKELRSVMATSGLASPSCQALLDMIQMELITPFDWHSVDWAVPSPTQMMLFESKLELLGPAL